MKTTLDLPQELLRQVEAKADRENVTASAVVAKTLIREFGPISTAPKQRIQVPLIDTGAPFSLTNAEIEEILTDDLLGRR